MALTSSNITQVGTKSMSVHCFVCNYETLFSWCVIFLKVVVFWQLFDSPFAAQDVGDYSDKAEVLAFCKFVV